jgi:hypothetical protein
MESKGETDRTILNNKPDIIVRDNEKTKKEAEKSLNYKDLTTEIAYSVSLYMDVKNKKYSTNNRGNWNYLKIIQTVST